MEEILKRLHAIRPLSPELEAHLRKILCRYFYRKGKFLLEPGTVADHILFINGGLIRSYSIVNGKPVTNWFMEAGDIIIAVISFLRRVPANEYIEALEDSEVWGITHAELWETYGLFPEFLLHGLQITSEYYCRSEERHESQRRRHPEDKYAFIMQRHPDLLLRVRNGDMASYLGVSTRTYLNIRKDFSEGRIPSYSGSL